MHALSDSNCSAIRNRHRLRFPDVTKPLMNSGHFLKISRISVLLLVERSTFAIPRFVFFRFTPIWLTRIFFFFSLCNLAPTAGWEIFRICPSFFCEVSGFFTSRDMIFLSILSRGNTESPIFYNQIFVMTYIL